METTVEPKKHTLSVMSPQHGDYKVVWNPDSPAEVAAAQASFDKLTREGHRAYRVDKGGDKAEILRSFDPKAAAIIMAPPVQGG